MQVSQLHFGSRFIVLLAVFHQGLKSCSGVTLETESLGNGTTAVICTATDVIEMSWTISGIQGQYYFRETIKFDVILLFGKESVQLLPGLTLLSKVSQELSTPYSHIRSIMTINQSQFNGSTFFICRGRTAESSHHYFQESAIVRNEEDFKQGDMYLDPGFVGMPVLYPSMFRYSPSRSFPSPSITSTPNSPPTSPTSPMANYIPVGVWIALGILSLLILALVAITIIVSLIAYKYKKKTNNSPEMLHSYDYVGNRGIYTLTPSTTPTSGATRLPSGDQGDLEPQYIDMIPNESYARQNQVNTYDHLSIGNPASGPETLSQYNMRINTAYHEESMEASYASSNV